ncbi:type II secretion system protein [Luteolibacter ambystomatis]|uniref:Type II secretion system protein n=2 Tax=Luteolibacter ambystomatis TaxID=2824561 RepID=A0A975J0N9_9BACT|nr:type II secretion system protein [Luteolibacter ambystomatis]QUE51839.1 type II secretion system protein [Luteolibacter ambystomatis]
MQSRNSNRRPGMTLLEMTVVILVLLTLIGVLFIGARAWKKGSDRAACILNLRNFQQAVRSYANINALNPNSPAPGLRSQIVGFGKFMENEPVCPSGAGLYTAPDPDTIPDIGVVYLSCPNIAKAGSTDHFPVQHNDW